MFTIRQGLVKYFPFRMIHIKSSSTPNPSCLKFTPGKPVTGDTGSTMDIPNAKFASISPLAVNLFAVGGVTRVFFGKDFVSVTKEENLDWSDIKPDVEQTIKQHYESNQPLFTDDSIDLTDDLKINPDDSEALQMVKEIIQTRVRPFV